MTDEAVAWVGVCLLGIILGVGIFLWHIERKIDKLLLLATKKQLENKEVSASHADKD